MGSPQDGFGQTGVGDSPGISKSSADQLSAASASFGIAGASLGAYGQIEASKGIAAGDTFKADMLENSAKRGQVAAVEVGADMTRKLAMDLGNIDTIRAASHTDPTSPSGAAVRDYRESVGLSQKAVAVDNIVAQSRQEEAEAAYLRQAGKSALLSGYVSAGASVLKALGQAAEMGA